MSRSRDVSAVQNNLGVVIPPAAAGKNAVINGGFDIWQRGTSFSVGTSWTYTADRWTGYCDSGTATYAQESTVVPTGSRYSLKITAGGTQNLYAQQVIETANTLQFAGKTVTFSAKVASSASMTVQMYVQYSTAVDDWSSPTNISATSGATATPTSTTFVDLVGVFAIPSTAKTLRLYITKTSTFTSGQVLYLGQVQFELGSTATPFARAGGNIQGELAACQRYYWRWTAGGVYRFTGAGAAYTTTQASIYIAYPVTMRTGATALDTSGMTCHLLKNDSYNSSGSFSLANQQESNTQVIYTHGSGIFAAGDFVNLSNAGTSTGYIGFTAEL